VSSANLSLSNKLTDLRTASMNAWDDAIEGAGRDGRDGAEERDAARECRACWDAAIKAAKSGDLAGAASELEDARSVSAAGGDDQFERAAIALVEREQNGPGDDEIRALEAESAEAGDLAMVAIARRALDELDSWEFMRDEPSALIADEEAVRRALAMTVQAASSECARVIAAAEAQR
jgi:hypothetical protein